MNALLVSSNLFIRTRYYPPNFIGEETVIPPKETPNRVELQGLSGSACFDPIWSLTITHTTSPPAAVMKQKCRGEKPEAQQVRCSAAG